MIIIFFICAIILILLYILTTSKQHRRRVKTDGFDEINLRDTQLEFAGEIKAMSMGKCSSI